MSTPISKLVSKLLEDEQAELPFDYSSFEKPMGADLGPEELLTQQPDENWLELGTYVSASGDPQYIIGRLLRVLDHVDKEAADSFITDPDNADVMAYINDEGDEPEYAFDFVNELESTLNTYTPPYTYFGSNEGDASLGVWVGYEHLEEDIENEEVAHFESKEEWDANMPVGTEYTYIGSKPFDGMGSLYFTGSRKLIWSV